MLQEGEELKGWDRGAHQHPHAHLRAGSVSGAWRGRDGQMGWLGHLGAQFKADRPKTGGTTGRMRWSDSSGRVEGSYRRFPCFNGISHRKLASERNVVGASLAFKERRVGTHVATCDLDAHLSCYCGAGNGTCCAEQDRNL